MTAEADWMAAYYGSLTSDDTLRCDPERHITMLFSRDDVLSVASALAFFCSVAGPGGTALREYHQGQITWAYNNVPAAGAAPLEFCSYCFATYWNAVGLRDVSFGGTTDLYRRMTAQFRRATGLDLREMENMATTRLRELSEEG